MADLTTFLIAYKSPVRRSRDVLVNGNGSSFLELCDDFGLLILNGRGCGDREGQFTFIGGPGCSVNDLCCVSFNCISIIGDFQVLPQSFSDHLPIYFSVFCGLERILDDSCTLPLLPQLTWQDSKAQAYKETLSTLVDKIPPFSNDADMNVSLLTGLIKNASSSQFTALSASCIRLFRKKPWFDFSCLRARQRTFKLLNLLRKTNSHFAISAYREAKSSYKELCRTKKTSFFASINLQFKAARDSKQMWHLINLFKHKGFVCGNKITIDAWVQHFYNLFNPVEPAPLTMYAEPSIFCPSLDSPFSMDELLSVVSNSKNKKAPGLDRITFEYYKNAPTNFLEKLLSLFNFHL